MADEAVSVCDNRGGTHLSMCHFRNTKCIYEKIHPNSNLTVDYRGECCEECPLKAKHAMIQNNSEGIQSKTSMVCDQHGFVYENKCEFDKSACELKKKYVIHKSPFKNFCIIYIDKNQD